MSRIWATVASRETVRYPSEKSPYCLTNCFKNRHFYPMFQRWVVEVPPSLPFKNKRYPVLYRIIRKRSNNLDIEFELKRIIFHVFCGCEQDMKTTVQRLPFLSRMYVRHRHRRICLVLSVATDCCCMVPTYMLGCFQNEVRNVAAAAAVQVVMFCEV